MFVASAMPYRCALLHPAPRTAAQWAANDRLLGAQSLGIEVTIPVAPFVYWVVSPLFWA